MFFVRNALTPAWQSLVGFRTLRAAPQRIPIDRGMSLARSLLRKAQQCQGKPALGLILRIVTPSGAALGCVPLSSTTFGRNPGVYVLMLRWKTTAPGENTGSGGQRRQDDDCVERGSADASTRARTIQAAFAVPADAAIAAPRAGASARTNAPLTAIYSIAR
jgi:hypothetical protein